MGPTWGPPGSCRSQVGPMLAPSTLLSGLIRNKGAEIQLVNRLNSAIPRNKDNANSLLNRSQIENSVTLESNHGKRCMFYKILIDQDMPVCSLWHPENMESVAKGNVKSDRLTSLYNYSDFIMSAMASQITSIATLCSAVCSGAHQRIHQSFALLAFVRGIHRWLVDSPHKGPVTHKIFPFDAPLSTALSSEKMWWPCMLLCSPSCMEQYPHSVKTAKTVDSFQVKLENNFYSVSFAYWYVTTWYTLTESAPWVPWAGQVCAL